MDQQGIVRGIDANGQEWSHVPGVDQAKTRELQKFNLDIASRQQALENSRLDADSRQIHNRLLLAQLGDLQGNDAPPPQQMAASLGVPAAPPDPLSGLSRKAREQYQTKMYQAGDKQVSAAEQEARDAQQLAQDAKRFQDLNATTTTGPVSGSAPVAWARKLGSSNLQEMESISNKLVPKMRQPGSGATSDFDAKMFAKGTIGIDKDKKANDAIALGMIAASKQNQDRADFMRAYLEGNGSPEFAAELTNRTTSQNAARTAALEGIAGTPGSIATAKASRNAATDAMRESVLSRAGDIDATGLLSGIDNLLADPNNAGKISQQALSQIRNQIAGAVGDGGTINARALYAIRKDINDVMSGKLQGEAGNLRYASGQLNSVKGMFDDAIDQASRRMQPSSSTDMVPFKATPATEAQAGMTGAGNQPMPSWREYLNTYTEQSKPINQMEILQDVFRRMQSGATDTSGNLVLSPSKLNQILKNEGADLAKKLTPEQLQTLRNVSADMNASQLAMNAGKATGSNTVQNIAQDQLLQQLLGQAVGSSMPARTVLGNVMRIPYSRANQEIQQQIGNALLDPQEAARLLEMASTPNKLARIAGRGKSAARALPVVAADPNER